MRAAVISDTHDRLDRIEGALRMIGETGADMLVHCGDLCSPFVIDRLAAFPGPVHIVFGNNDGDRYTIGIISSRFTNVTIHGEMGTVETPFGLIAFTHRPEFARGLACTGEYSVVFCGHSHRATDELVGETPLINPGDLLGLIENPGWVLYDLEEGTWRRFMIEP